MPDDLKTVTMCVVPPQHIDRAWMDGACNLAKATRYVAGECTADQLKMRLAYGELTLLTMMQGGAHVAWVAVQFIQHANMRVLHIESLYAPKAFNDETFGLVANYARAGGASSIQCAAAEGPKRLYQQKFGFEQVYTIMRRKL